MEAGGQTATGTLSEAVAKEIRVLLVRRDMKQTDLADRMGVSEMWVSRRLRGAQPIDLNDLERFAEALNVEVTELLPVPTPGRVLTTIGAPTPARRPNAGLARSSVRRRKRGSSKIPCPTGGPRPDATHPDVAVVPTQRRPMLASGPGQRISA